MKFHRFCNIWHLHSEFRAPHCSVKSEVTYRLSLASEPFVLFFLFGFSALLLFWQISDLADICLGIKIICIKFSKLLLLTVQSISIRRLFEASSYPRIREGEVVGGWHWEAKGEYRGPGMGYDCQIGARYNYFLLRQRTVESGSVYLHFP